MSEAHDIQFILKESKAIWGFLGNWVHRPVTTSLFQCFQQLPHCCLVGHRTMDRRHQNEAKGCLDIMSHWIMSDYQTVRLSVQNASETSKQVLKYGSSCEQQMFLQLIRPVYNSQANDFGGQNFQILSSDWTWHCRNCLVATWRFVQPSETFRDNANFLSSWHCPVAIWYDWYGHAHHAPKCNRLQQELGHWQIVLAPLQGGHTP